MEKVLLEQHSKHFNSGGVMIMRLTTRRLYGFTHGTSVKLYFGHCWLKNGPPASTKGHICCHQSELASSSSRVSAEVPRNNLTKLRIDSMIGALSEREEAEASELIWFLLNEHQLKVVTLKNLFSLLPPSTLSFSISTQSQFETAFNVFPETLLLPAVQLIVECRFLQPHN